MNYFGNDHDNNYNSNDLCYNNDNNHKNNNNNSVLDQNCIVLLYCFPLLLFFLFSLFSPAGNIANNLRWPVAADHNYILPQSCVELGQVRLLWCHRLCVAVCAAHFNDEKHLRGENGSCHSGTRESNQNNTTAIATFHAARLCLSHRDSLLLSVNKWLDFSALLQSPGSSHNRLNTGLFLFYFN